MVRADLMHAMRVNMSRVIDVFRGIDKDRNNFVDKGEFREALLTALGDKYAPETLDAVFDVFDVDGSGYISYEELKEQLMSTSPRDTPTPSGASKTPSGKAPARAPAPALSLTSPGKATSKAPARAPSSPGSARGSRGGSSSSRGFSARPRGGSPLDA